MSITNPTSQESYFNQQGMSPAGVIFNRPPCLTCKRRDFDLPTCGAFPQGIPEIILRGENDHRKPVAGDGGLLYDPVGA